MLVAETVLHFKQTIIKKYSTQPNILQIIFFNEKKKTKKFFKNRLINMRPMTTSESAEITIYYGEDLSINVLTARLNVDLNKT